MKPCIENLLKSVEGIKYELIIFDNKSEEKETIDYLKEVEKQTGALIIISENHCSFGVANNLAMDHAKGKYLLFLNNDTIPQLGFLEEMVACFKRHEDAGIIGAKLLFPESTKIQHIGSMIRSDGLPTHLYYGRDVSEPQVSRPVAEERRCVAVTAACMLMPKKLFIDLGGFDEGYKNGFEDTDLCFKAKLQKKRIYYCPKALLYHQEHGSGPTKKEDFDHNVKLFVSKWRHRLPMVNVL